MARDVSDFLHDTEWQNAAIEWFNADWSPRDYARLTRKDGETAILLKSPPDDSPESLIGHQIGKWVIINRHFKSLGLNVPTIFKEDLKNGFVLMEDFGNETIADKGLTAYLKATDILVTMREHPSSLQISSSFGLTKGSQATDPLIKYEETHVYKALRFYPTYILNDETKTNAWFSAWKTVEESLPPCPRALTHIDFAAMNLMWVNGEIGIIDFQAACNGPFVYDIVNLLEDIRRDVPEEIKQTCKARYCKGLTAKDKAAFDAWYPVISAQFFARILGQIQFLSKEKGRTDLIQYYDNVFARWEKLLRLPQLAPILQVVKGTS